MTPEKVIRAASMIALVLGVAAAVPSCDRSNAPRAGSAVPTGGHQRDEKAADASRLSPIDTVRRVREYRLAGRLGLIAEYLVPDQRQHVVELIHAVDRLLWANQVLQAAVTSHFGPASAHGFDRSQAGNAIGVFSQDVDILDERIDGETAGVGIQVAGRVPLDEVKLVRREGRWLIQTDPPIPGVADELRRLANMLADTARMLDRRAMTPIELKKELDLREASIGRRITALIRKTPP